MHPNLLILIVFIDVANSSEMYDYGEVTPRQYIDKLHEHEREPERREDEPEPEPVTAISVTTKEMPKNIICDDYESYKNKCIAQAKLLYDSVKAPPMSHELVHWCAALKSLCDCERDWNLDCKDLTDKKFDEEIINGQIRVIDRVCNDDWFSERYDISLNACIAVISDEWKYCYMALKLQVDQHKNSSRSWTHYEAHFYLCCARTRFRRCTLETLLHFTDSCAPQQAIILQKFSSIVSEGEVFQDCSFNMVYQNCPSGDPRPPRAMLLRLMGERSTPLALTVVDNGGTITTQSLTVWCPVLALLNVYFQYLSVLFLTEMG